MEQTISQKEVSLKRVFSIPAQLSEHIIKDKYLILAPEQANWLVLNNNQYFCFNLLKNRYSLGKVKNIMEKNYNKKYASKILQETLVEMEVKQFYFDIEVKDKKDQNSMQIFLTKKCNLKCTHCYLLAGEPDANELKYEKWVDLLSEFRGLGGENITISGGEPLIRRDSINIIKYAKDLGLNVILLTNGTLINKNIAMNLIPLLSEIQFSLDGPDEETNAIVRGKGVYYKVLKSISFFKGSNVKISLAMCPLPSTIKSFKNKVVPFAKKLLSECDHRIIIRITGRIMEGRNVKLVDKKLERKWIEITDELVERIYGKEWLDKVNITFFKPNIRLKNCGYGESACIAPNGDVYPCSVLFNCIGNIRKDSLKEIGIKLQNLRAETSIDNFIECKSCDLKYFCGGRCRIANFYYRGHMCKVYCNEELKNKLYKKLIDMNKFLYEINYFK